MHSQILSSRLGAELQSFKLDGIEKIHQGQECTDENNKVYWDKRFSVLFPIVGKLKQNKTIINGRTFEIQEDGIVQKLEFEPISKLDNFHSYVFKSNASSKVKYPYDFNLYVTYRSDENKLMVIYKVENTGINNMPFGLGSKPCFCLNKEDVENENYYIEFDEDEDKIHFLYLVDGLVGTEYAKDILIDKRKIIITNDLFTNDAIIIQGINAKKITLRKNSNNKKILTMDFSDFQYLSIWSKKEAPFIAIEPWTQTPDTVNSKGIFEKKPDNIIIAPKRSIELKYNIEFFN